MMDFRKPDTPKDAYLQYLAGNKDIVLPEPKTDKDLALYRICMNQGSGSGSGGGGEFVVTFTMDNDGNYTADKTVEELVEAHESGKNISAVTFSTYGNEKFFDYIKDYHVTIAASWASFRFTIVEATDSDLYVQTIVYENSSNGGIFVKFWTTEEN